MTTREHIAYLTSYYPYASHTFVLREVEALRALGAEVRTASIRTPGANHLIGTPEEAAKASTFYVLDAAKNPLHLVGAHLGMFLRNPRRYGAALALAIRTRRAGIKGWAKQIAYLAEAGVLANWMIAEGITQLHNHFAGPSCAVAMIAGRMAGIPFSFTLHGPSDLIDPMGQRVDEKIKACVQCFCISNYAAGRAAELVDPSQEAKFRIIHCGVFPETYDTPPKETDTGLKLLFVGRLAPVKGLPILVEAFKAARARNPGITLDIVGDGDERPTVEAAAADVGGITLHGYLSQAEVAERLRAADALVLPSFAEGVPVVLMEAMASARPVIATRVGGVSELVEDGVSGFLIPHDDPAALIEAIDRLAAMPLDERQSMGIAGRAKVRADFDVRLEAARILAIWRGTIDDGRRPDFNS